jgi:hypothetical protein
MVLGPRLGRFDPRGRARTIPGHNLNFVALGGFVLWFGWFGFNGGSTVGANVNIGLINLNTQLAASAGTGATLLVCLLNRTPITVPAVVNGSLAGLVGITAGCATMEPLWAVITGATASVVAHLGERMLLHFRLDDVVGAVAVHAFAGAWGTAELLPDPTAALSAYKTRRRTSAYASYTLAEVEAFSVLVDKWLSLTQSAAAIDIGNFVRRNLGRLNINTDLKLQVEHWLEDEKQRIKVPRVDIQDLRKIINLFYIGFCEYVGPTRADTLLAEAVTRLKSNGGAAFSEVFNKLL